MKLFNKKGIMQNLNGLIWGIGGFAIGLGLILVILGQFGNTQPGLVNSTVQTIIGYLGTTGTGLGTWIPVIIVVSIAVLLMALLGVFGGGGKRGRY